MTCQVTYYNYKGEQHSKQLRLGKEGALILRSILAKESKHTGKWMLTALWDEIADLYVKQRVRICIDCETKDSGLVETVGNCYVCWDSLCSTCSLYNKDIRAGIEAAQNVVGVGVGAKDMGQPTFP